ncbi:MAG TPA: XrtA/PEP-CTERM system TPR-repeat protein PrsT [Burkholderiaceae bacterium]|nr:XrtA/PEP-CTERM system TPR-repeat protein PrsT [Burkholderiaceae bacterium]
MQIRIRIFDRVRHAGRALSLLLWAFGLAVALAGCNKDSPESLVASARDYAAKGNYSAAVIQLKNALQQAPNNSEARFLLGIALLETHDPASAEKELRRALELKQPEDKVLPALARSLFEMRDFGALFKEFGERQFNDPSVEARVRTYLGEAYLAGGDSGGAAASFDAALKAVPDYPAALVGQVRLALRDGRIDDATRIADVVIKASPQSGEAYALKADALLATGDREGAKALLHKALQVDPTSLPAHFSLVSLALDEGAFEAAAAQLEAARKVARGDLRIVYFDALLAYRKGDLSKARDSVLRVLKSAPDHVPSLVLAGAIELQAGQLATAEDSLRRALARAPGHIGARRLLVATLLRSGQPARALEALQPLVGGGVEPSPPMLMLAGETYLANGDLGQASSYFERAAQVDGEGTAARTRLGQIAIARGHVEEGIHELEAAASADSKDNQADIALVMSHLRRRDMTKALAAAQALTKKQPTNPVSFQLLGSVQALQKDNAGARASFERALEIAPTFLPAAFSLANLDLAEKKTDAARKRLAAMLEKDPKNEQIILAQAEVELRSGAPSKDVVALLQKAINANPQSSNARIALINHHLRNKDPRAALAAAQDAAAALPKDTRVIEALAFAQEAAGETNLAIDSINRLIQMRPGLAEPLLHLAALQAKGRNYDRAIETLQRAQKIAPENRQIDRDLVATMLNQGKPDLALKQTRDLQTRAPKFAGGYILEGDVHVTQKRWTEAERAYRDALKLDPDSGSVAVKVVSATLAGGKSAEADAFATRWLADHPRDTALRMMLADRALRARDYKNASARYEAVLSIEPNNVVALNNLAWIGGETGDAKAVSYAERAAKLAPESASVLETLGTLLVKQGDSKRGLEYLSRARELAPARYDVRLSYARALAASGQKDAARKELREIAEARDDVAEKRAAAEMLQKL